MFLGCGPLCLNIKIMECSHITSNTLEEAYGVSRRREDSICLLSAGNATAACGSLEVLVRKEECDLTVRKAFLPDSSAKLQETAKYSHGIVSAHIKEKGCVKRLRCNDLVSGSHSKS